MSFTLEDRQYMARALQLAQRGLYTTDPNPRVGAVLVNEGHIVGEGWHQWAGEPHAERIALDAVGERARGATCYVTLEPCCHQGRTGPCVQALIDAGVQRVVAAMKDPNPQVAGQGLALLDEAGIATACGLLEDDARALNPGFIARMTRSRPFVRLKLAMSLDGRTAMASGESKWITGAAAREDVQRIRARSSAIVTGVGTVLTDNPAFTVRPDQWQLADYPSYPAYPDHVEARVRQPLRVVLDGRLQTASQSKVIAGQGQSLVVAREQNASASKALEDAGAQVLILPGSGSGLDLVALLAALAARECNEILVESGPTLAAACVREKLADEIWVYMAPVLMGSSARPLLNLPDIVSMDQRIQWKLTDVRHLGADLRLTLRPEN